jgi:tRNA(fMet)-specific endonuclease VapC
MKYLLDTNVCIALMRGKNPLVAARFAAHSPSQLCVCPVVVGELCVGAIRSSAPVAEQAKVDSFLTPYQSIPFDDTIARKYAEVRADLESRGLPVTDFDMMIAATALVHGLILVTNNTRDFSRISGLNLENWEVP